MRKLFSFFVFALALALVVPAYAEVQNVKVSGDIETMAISQSNFDLMGDGIGATMDRSSWFQSIARLQVEADLTDDVTACVRLTNERDWDTNSAANEEIDIDLANVTLKDILDSPLTLTVGRQELNYADGLVVGDPDTNGVDTPGRLNAPEFTKRKAFDSVKLSYDLEPLVIDLAYAKIDETFASGNATSDEDLLALNIAYALDEYNTNIEAYYVYNRDDNFAASMGSFGTTGVGSALRAYEENEVHTIGVAIDLKPIDALSLNLGVAGQFGELRDDVVTAATQQAEPLFSRDREAWAFDAGIEYAFDYEYSPVLTLGYAFRSGEESGNSGDFEGWDPVCENQTRGILADTIFGGQNSGSANASDLELADGTNAGANSNTSTFNVRGSIVPAEDLKFTVDWYHLRLDEGVSGTRTTTANTRRADKDLGDEIDLVLDYDYTEDVSFSLFAGWFLPGDSFVDANDATANEVYGKLSVVF